LTDLLLDDGFATAKKVNEILKKSLDEASRLSPETLSDQQRNILNATRDAQIIFEKLLAHEQAIKALLGKDSPQHILVLFQNKNEIRATGGFIGSLGFLELSSGKVTHFSFRDVYDFDWQLKTHITPPREILPLTDRLRLRDANFSLDFPTSAQRIQWFLEHEKGPTVDTIIAIDQSFLGSVLRTTGPIEIPNSNGFLLTEDNFDITLSYLVEGKFFGAGGKEVSPKQFLEDLLPIILERLSERASLDFVKDILSLSLEKHLLAFSSDPQIEIFFDALGISGNLHPFEVQSENDISNGFALSKTSISTNKSDGYITQNIVHETSIDNEGNIVGMLQIQRIHTWGEKEEKIFTSLVEHFGHSEYVGTDDLRRIMGKGTNKVFMNVFLPKGIEILSANSVFSEEFKQQQTKDFTEISFLFPEIAEGETKEILFSYRLPQKFQNGNRIINYFVSQPGLTNQTLEESLILDGKRSLIFSGPLLEDRSFIILP
jgi:hypothetical protein